jgi:hypothetical protein
MDADVARPTVKLDRFAEVDTLMSIARWPPRPGGEMCAMSYGGVTV